MKKMLALLVALSMMFIACACSASAGQVQVMTSFTPCIYSRSMSLTVWTV